MTLKPEEVTVVVDSREKIRYNLFPLRSEIGTLATGDFTVKGMESIVAIERKTLTDLLGCIGVNRERFEREIQRLLAYPTRCIVVEATFSELAAGEWRSKVTPAAAIGSCLSWICTGIPILFCGNQTEAEKCVSRMLFISARRRWRESRALVQSIEGAVH